MIKSVLKPAIVHGHLTVNQTAKASLRYKQLTLTNLIVLNSYFGLLLCWMVAYFIANSTTMAALGSARFIKETTSHSSTKGPPKCGQNIQYLANLK